MSGPTHLPAVEPTMRGSIEIEVLEPANDSVEQLALDNEIEVYQQVLVSMNQSTQGKEEELVSVSQSSSNRGSDELPQIEQRFKQAP